MTPASVLSSSSASAAAALDLLILTFNCAKNLIDVPVFAAHLQGALRQNSGGDGLPDLVAFSLQEVAPLSYAFIGSYFLNPYYAKYEEALNLASSRFLEEEQESNSTADLEEDEGSSHEREEEEEGLLKPNKKKSQQQSQAATQTKPYTLVRAKNVGMTAIMLFARDPETVTRVEEAECGFGAADMGNKGAVGLRVSLKKDRDSRDETEVTLVATHLAAMEWNLKKRNANWRSIASGLTFGNPKEVVPGVFGENTSGPRADQSGAGDKVGPGPSAAVADAGGSDSSEATSEADDEDEAERPLVTSDGESLAPEHRAALKDISVFKPSSYLFVAGDLNYRISSTTPPPMSTFPSFDADSPNHYSTFLPRDQLTQERLAGRAFKGMSEAPVSFGPTYKYNILEKPDEAVNEEAVRAGVEHDGVPEVPWKFAPHRWPGWCDRVLYLDLPSWLKTKSQKVEVKAYNSLPVVKTSDHRAVFLRVQVPVVSGENMRKGLEMEESNSDDGELSQDPRINPPVLVDAHAWERREAARRKELLVGMSAFLWSTQEGAVLLGTMVLLGVGSWYASRGW
ncbi:DNase I-like protein [Rhypophila decipiens]|uniref:DNase I-like protein n=1 Tax=Rhypophila decipiens TaxID=261697 RepID=A0AAN7B656_9PEZI|nr:DNase I-like protein [Rhypophila decipiens]